MELAIRVHVEELPEGLFLATSDELPGLVAQARTIAETLEIARDVAGKLIEARRERGRITITPKSVVDRAIAEGLEDVRKGRVRGPFHKVEQTLDSLKGRKQRASRKAS